tara:strand:+ start:577 stop:726 length:150 start_codon:yes stop_codon:yes gene_type:complete
MSDAIDIFEELMRMMIMAQVVKDRRDNTVEVDMAEIEKAEKMYGEEKSN